MTVKIQRSAILAFSAQQMFDLVNDIKDYPLFVPYCCDSEVLLQSDDMIEARLGLEKGPVRQAFTTRNQLSREQAQLRIELGLVDGPFQDFYGLWSFDVLDESACRVNLDIRFSLESGLKNFALKYMFEKVATQLVDAFCQRAKVVYG